ncbi:hypothetical protein C7M61_001790 [Candidozyma pseudohaemuli]|uniref:Uncharacterized protein n=1 Tax=Candidozyma pseudohaemuli TaxID=418784 RepID=A0A2P7YT85_9ASCO|nr:hypothetical protein C7M61_001790 [[Candida] pseudohaemulonii]PSK39187.1 hypothetical protein C7M61_001790 [[Candida] pseudohaemulonii]
MASRCIELETKALVEKRVLKAIDGRQKVQDENNYQVYSKRQEMYPLEDQDDLEEMEGEPCQSVDINFQRVELNNPAECSYKYRDRPRYISWSSCRSVSYVSDPGGGSSEYKGTPEMAAKQEVKSVGGDDPNISETLRYHQAGLNINGQQALSSEPGKAIHVQVVPCRVHTLRFRDPSEAEYEPASTPCSCKNPVENISENRVKRVLAVPELEHLDNRQIRLPPVYTSRSSTSFLFVGVNFVSQFRRVVLRVKSKFRRSSLFEKRLSRKYGFSSVLEKQPPQDSSIEEEGTLDTFSQKSSIVTVDQSSSVCLKDEILQLVLPTLSNVFTALLSYHADDSQSQYELAAYKLVEELCLKKAEFFNLTPRWEYLALCVCLDDSLLGEILWECMLEGKKAVDEYRERRLELGEFYGEQTVGYTLEEDGVEEETLDLCLFRESEIREAGTETDRAESNEGSNEETGDGNPWKEPSIYRLDPCYGINICSLNHSIEEANDDVKDCGDPKGFSATSDGSKPQLNDLMESDQRGLDCAASNIEKPPSVSPSDVDVPTERPSDVDDPIEGPSEGNLKDYSILEKRPLALSSKQHLESLKPSQPESGSLNASPSDINDHTVHPIRSTSLDPPQRSSNPPIHRSIKKTHNFHSVSPTHGTFTHDIFTSDYGLQEEHPRSTDPEHREPV